jgi:hypothetical protein
MSTDGLKDMLSSYGVATSFASITGRKLISKCPPNGELGEACPEGDRCVSS